MNVTNLKSTSAKILFQAKRYQKKKKNQQRAMLQQEATLYCTNEILLDYDAKIIQ